MCSTTTSLDKTIQRENHISVERYASLTLLFYLFIFVIEDLNYLLLSWYK